MEQYTDATRESPIKPSHVWLEHSSLDTFQILRTAGITCIQILQMVENVFGRSKFKHAIETMNRAKLEAMQVPRAKRKRYSPAYKQNLFNRQGGDCPWCIGRLLVPAHKNEVDHINVNLPPDEYENRKNHCLAHPNCNRTKGAMSIPQFSKHTGLSGVEILSKGMVDEAEETEGP